MNLVAEPSASISALIVEADAGLLEAYQQTLPPQGIHLTGVSSLAELEWLLQAGHAYDVLIVDLGKTDASERLDWLISLLGPQELDKAPVILLGDTQDNLLLERFQVWGGTDFLRLPVAPGFLAMKTRMAIESHRTLQTSNDQKKQLEKLLHDTRREGEMASYIFYSNLLDQNTDSIRGFNRYINGCTDFCADLVLARFSPSGSVFVLHADAMGHGLSATITLSDLVDVFHSMVNKGYALPMIVREMNRKLHAKLPPDRFLAAALIEIDIQHEQISVWNGGMPPVQLLNRKGEVDSLFESRNMALGILDTLAFDSSVERLPLPHEGALFGCSDGVLDQRNELGDAFGMPRLLSVLMRNAAGGLTGALVSELKNFSGLPSFDDDVSFYYVHFHELIHFLEQRQFASQGRYRQFEIAPFDWSLTLQGGQIVAQELPAMANEFLREMGLNQPFCQRAFTVISELINNAVDHGLLGLSSDIKADPEGFSEYFVLRDKMLRQLKPDAWLSISLRWQNDRSRTCLHVCIDHSGEGFDVERVMNRPKNELSGRGLILIQKLAARLDYENEGRRALVILE